MIPLSLLLGAGWPLAILMGTLEQRQYRKRCEADQRAARAILAQETVELELRSAGRSAAKVLNACRRVKGGAIPKALRTAQLVAEIGQRVAA